MSWLLTPPPLVRQSACSSYRYNNSLKDLYSYLSLKSHEQQTEEIPLKQKIFKTSKTDGEDETYDICRMPSTHTRTEDKSPKKDKG